MLTVRAEKERKEHIFKEQVSHCTSRLHRATGLLQFSIEALKETDPAAFLQVRAWVNVRTDTPLCALV